MSKVAIQGNASGTGVFTIASPNSNTDRTLTLPDEAGTVLTRAAGSPDNSVVVDASGNVGVGTSSPSQKLEVAGNMYINTSGNPYLQIKTSGAGNNPYIRMQADTNYWNIQSTFSNTNDDLLFQYNGTERMRLDSSGNLLVGKTGRLAGEKLSVEASGASGNTCAFIYGSADDRAIVISLHAGSSGGTSRKHYAFLDGGGFERGYITVNGSSTTYATSSDYRLKENIAPMAGALSVVQQLKPCTYTWKNSGIAGQGFIAHELAEVCPDAVTGEKDAVDAEGNPQYQGIDTSFLVATLTAAIQELKTINDAQAQTIESLTARVVALEGQQ